MMDTNDVTGRNSVFSTLNVLIVEDTPSDADILVLKLKNEGFQTKWRRVDNEADFLAALASPFDLILSDWVLPQFSGLRAFQILKDHDPEIPFIIVSGGIGEETAVAIMRQGAADYLLKDRLDRLGQAVRNALEQKKLRVERKHAEELLNLQASALNAAANAIIITDPTGVITWANPAFTILTGYTASEAIGKTSRELTNSGQHHRDFYKEMWKTILGGDVWHGELVNRRKDGGLFFEEMTITPIRGSDGQIHQFVAVKQDISQRIHADEALRKSSEELRQAYDSTLQGWSNALELREHETAGHSQRVVNLTINLARHLGVHEEELVHIQRGALLHDIGKMGIPDSILLKPGPLTEDEWKIMRMHPDFALQMLSIIPYLEPTLDIPHYHHEKWDGSGYPCGLKGEEIPLAARIFAVVDVFDALSNDRPYRKAWEEAAVIEYLKQQAGLHFDPKVVEVFLRLMDKGLIGSGHKLND